MISEINRVTILPGREAEFENAFAQARRLLLSVSGCRGARLLECLEEPGRYIIMLAWDRLEDHLDHYPATRQAVEVRALLSPHIVDAEMAHYRAIAGICDGDGH